jgi:GPH family glycoside/pentoside/hexuronide:cation symporter
MTLYALPAIPLSFLFVPLSALLPAFYASHLGLGLTAVGTSLLLSRILDLAVDPLLGRLSDVVRTRRGRRKTWMVLAMPLFMAGTYILFIPPVEVSFLYLFLASSVIYAGASMLGLSYSAWGAEIVVSYHGRAKIAGFRETANVLGIVIASSIPAITALYGHGVDGHTMGLLGIVLLVLLPLTVLPAVRWVPELPPQATQHGSWWASLQSVFRNRPFRWLCAGFVSINVATGITSATLIFYVQNYLQQPEVIGPALLVSFLSVLACVPLWVRISRRIGKHRAAGLSLLVAISINVVVTLQLEPGDGWLFVGLLSVIGGISAAFLTLPIGIVGDVIDFDTLKSGTLRGGLYFGVWSFFQKLAPALAIGGALPLLSLLGFDPKGENSESALDALRYVYCLAPAPFFLIGSLSLLLFPLDERRHDIIRRRLDVREARKHRASSPDVTDRQ